MSMDEKSLIITSSMWLLLRLLSMSLVEILPFAINHYAIVCNYVSFVITLSVHATTKLVLYKFWAI
jgi:hypothetical protein